MHGGLLLKAGADWRHNADATSMVRNHTGTYHYSTVENFASDALVFAKYGLADALDPFDQHNCDQRGQRLARQHRQLHGLGYLPCYSYYSQTMGPTELAPEHQRPGRLCHRAMAAGEAIRDVGRRCAGSANTFRRRSRW